MVGLASWTEPWEVAVAIKARFGSVSVGAEPYQ